MFTASDDLAHTLRDLTGMGIAHGQMAVPGGLSLDGADWRRALDNAGFTLHTLFGVYNGESLKDTDPKAKSLQEYREAAGASEGMSGVSTRFAFKVLSETFNYDVTEVAAPPADRAAGRLDQIADQLQKGRLAAA